MRALQKVGDIAMTNVDGTFRTGRIAAIDARSARLILADGQTVTRPRRDLKAVRPIPQSVLRGRWRPGRRRMWRRPQG